MADFFHGLTRGRLNAVYRLLTNALKADAKALLKVALTGKRPLMLAPDAYTLAAATLLQESCGDALAQKWFRPKRP